MPYTAKAVANYFLHLVECDDQQITPMKIQKLVYFAHGWYLAITDRPLIDEQIEAWQYGPVIPSLYDEFKQYGRSPITSQATDLVIDDSDEDMSFYSHTPSIDLTDKKVISVLKKVWQVYGKLTAVQLSNKTHMPGTPWRQVWGDGNVLKGTDIDVEIIKGFFQSQAQKTQVDHVN